MPVPANTPGLTLGRMLFDRKRFRTDTDTDPEIIACLERMAMASMGRGWDGPAKKEDPVYMAVFAQPDGLGAHNLYGGNPADPVNPTPLVVSASGSATVNWEEEGVLVLSSGTANFVGTGVTVTDVAGTATITITGGGGGTVTEAFKTIVVAGQSDIVADLAADTLTVAAGTGIVITTNAGTDTLTFAIDATTVAQVSFKFIAVAGQTTIEADSPTDTLTLVAGANVTITTNAGSDSITIASTDTNTTYTAGAGINLTGTKFLADPNTASHVGLVNPLTGDDSSADDAQIGLLWHAIANYDVAKDMLIGHAASDSSKPVVEYKTVADWLKTLPGYAAGNKQVLTNDSGTIEWNEVATVLNWLGAYNSLVNQSIGHDGSGVTLWQDDSSACP